MPDLGPLVLSAKLAAVATLLLIALGAPLAYWLAHSRSRARTWVETLVTLPLVLPPTVLGFYLLIVLAPGGPIGGALDAIGGPRLVFSFSGLVIGAVLFSLPFVIQPMQAAFTALGREPLDVAATLRAAPLDRFLTVAFPACAHSILAAAALGFAHTLGEFGVVLMLGGNIPGETRVASIAIYDLVDRQRYGEAHALAAVLVGTSIVALLIIHALRRRGARADR